MIALVDYGAGNLKSVSHAFEAIGHPVTVVAESGPLTEADAICLPGVGAFGAAMTALRRHNLVDALTEAVVNRRVPYLGICIGLQLLAETSEEAPGVPGLGWLPGAHVRRLTPRDPRARIPHLGWNSLGDAVIWGGLYRDVAAPTFYFAHSYHLVLPVVGPVVWGIDTGRPDRVLRATADHGGESVTASIQCGSVWAVQYHPEKSSSAGLQVLRNFVAMVNER